MFSPARFIVTVLFMGMLMAPGLGAQEATTSNSTEEVITIKRGDVLWVIVERTLGDRHLWKKTFDANVAAGHLSTDDLTYVDGQPIVRLEVGQKLLVKKLPSASADAKTSISEAERQIVPVTVPADVTVQPSEVAEKIEELRAEGMKGISAAKAPSAMTPPEIVPVPETAILQSIPSEANKETLPHEAKESSPSRLEVGRTVLQIILLPIAGIVVLIMLAVAFFSWFVRPLTEDSLKFFETPLTEKGVKENMLPFPGVDKSTVETILKGKGSGLISIPYGYRKNGKIRTRLQWIQGDDLFVAHITVRWGEEECFEARYYHQQFGVRVMVKPWAEKFFSLKDVKTIYRKVPGEPQMDLRPAFDPRIPRPHKARQSPIESERREPAIRRRVPEREWNLVSCDGTPISGILRRTEEPDLHFDESGAVTTIPLQIASV